MSRPPLGDTLDVLGLSIPWYSLLIMAGVAVALALAIREERRLRLPQDTMLNLALVAIPLGIIGARLYYVVFEWGRFASNPWEIFYIWQGGLAIYGAVLGGLAAGAIVSRRMHVPLASLMDAVAPGLVLAQAIGRWGNYANMEAYGVRISNEAAQFFPLAVEIPVVTADGTTYWYWHMATFFYESMWCLIVFILLMACRRGMRSRGDVFAWYVLLYGAGRTVVEGLRTDSLTLVISGGEVRVSQVLSAVMTLAVAGLFFARIVRSRRRIRLADWIGWAQIALALTCTFLGEFERNAYQMLFIPAQVVLGVMLVLDVVFLAHFVRRTGRLGAPGAWAVAAAACCLLTLLLGLGRFGAANFAYVTLRQSVAMLHVILSGAWFYLRAGRPGRRRGQPEQTAPAEAMQEEAS